MPNYTTNLNLVKPLVTEQYDIAKVTNDNANIIDSTVGDLLYTENNYILDEESITDSLDKLDIAINNKQDELVSGTNIKTINGSSILSSGDLLLATKSTEVTATLSSASWAGASAPFTYDLTVSGVTTTSNQEILPSTSITLTELEALQGANIIDAGQSTNTINLKAFGTKPTVDIPIRVILRGDK